MDNWEIDDETMSKCYDEFKAQWNVERNNDLDDVEYVPETQFDPIPHELETEQSSLNARLSSGGVHKRSGKEIVDDTCPGELQPKALSLNERLRAVVANQRPGKEICFDGNILEPLHPIGPTLPSGAYPVCHCGDECVVVVAKTEANAGR